jgi:hypothetical protein
MSSRYANRVYAGRSFPNQSLRSATKLAARAFESNCVSGGVLILESKRPDTFYLPRRIEQIYFGKNDSLWSTNDKTTLILIFKIACCNCTLPAANLHYLRRCSCGATSRARVSPGKSVGVRRRRKVRLVKLPTVVDKNKHRDLTSMTVQLGLIKSDPSAVPAQMTCEICPSI